MAGGRSLPLGIASASICVSWIRTTTIMGSSEAGMWFGVGGGFNYGWGAAVPFLALIPIALLIRKRMPRATTFTEFIRQRCGAVGAGYLFNTLFGIPFKVTAIVVPLVFTSYIYLAGLRGSVFNDVFQFLVLTAVMFVLIPLVIVALKPATMYENLVGVVTIPNNPNHNPAAR